MYGGEVQGDLLFMCWRSQVYLSRVGSGRKWQALCVDKKQEGWVRDRAADARCRPGRQTAQAGVRKRRFWEWKQGDWSDRSVHVSSSIHHTVPLWFNQTRNVLTRFDCRSTGECVVMQAPAHAYWTKISSIQVNRYISLAASSTWGPNVLFPN